MSDKLDPREPADPPRPFTPEQVDLAAYNLRHFQDVTFNGFPQTIAMLKAYAKMLRAYAATLPTSPSPTKE